MVDVLQNAMLVLVAENNANKALRLDYTIIRRIDFIAVGRASLRLEGEESVEYNGNIGYEIFEPFRGEGYAFAAASLLIKKAAECGMTRAIFTCETDNTASRRIIESLGGGYLDTVAVPKDYVYFNEGMQPRHRFIVSDILRK